jgi:hypothetical protein
MQPAAAGAKEAAVQLQRPTPVHARGVPGSRSLGKSDAHARFMALSAKAQLSDSSGDTHERFMNLVKESPRPKVLRDDSPSAKAAAAGPSRTSAARPSHVMTKPPAPSAAAAAVTSPTTQRVTSSAQSTSSSAAAQPMSPPAPRARRTRASAQDATAEDGSTATASRARTGPGSVLYPKGTQVRKNFNAGWFNGKVSTAFDAFLYACTSSISLTSAIRCVSECVRITH